MTCNSIIDRPLTKLDVRKAKNDSLPNKRFVNLRHLTEYIHSNKSKYQAFREADYNQIRYRVNKSIVGMGWEEFTAKGCRNTVYIDPEVEGE